MYRCFKLMVETSDYSYMGEELIDFFRKRGGEIKNELQSQVDTVLSSVTNKDGIIDGESLANTWFRSVKKDIFLSYSHDDEDLALMIAGMLNALFGLSVFVDVVVWGSADTLLKEIDNRYCLQKNGTYNYYKRNFSTSHVHAMLTTSIMKVMDQAEAVFFLNTPNSTYKLNNGFSKEHTLSPWIYEEIMLSSIIRKRDWQEHRQFRLDEAMEFQKTLGIAYPLEIEDFALITFEDIDKWQCAWDERKENDKGRYGNLMLKEYEKVKHPLNVLYEIVLGVE